MKETINLNQGFTNRTMYMTDAQVPASKWIKQKNNIGLIFAPPQNSVRPHAFCMDHIFPGHPIPNPT